MPFYLTVRRSADMSIESINMRTEPVQVTAAAVIHNQVKPEFIRLPGTGKRCPYTHLSRSKLNELILPCEANDYHPPVRSKVLRQRGQTKGARLIVYQSLLDFIHSQDPDTASGKKGGLQ
jgi:hypothetical protein